MKQARGNALVYVAVVVVSSVLVVGITYVYLESRVPKHPTTDLPMNIWESLEQGDELDDVLAKLPEPTSRIENGPMVMLEYRTQDKVYVLYFDEGELDRREPGPPFSEE